jgi:hypothetical protein
VLEAVNSDATFDGRPDEVTMLTALVEVQTREFLDWGLEAVKTYLSKAAK